MIPIAYRDNPFVSGARTYKCPEGMNIAEIINSVPDLPRGFESHGMVCINGEKVDKKYWHLVRPKVKNENPVIVTLHLCLRGPDSGEGTGGKNTLATVISIVAVVAAAAVTGGALGPAGLALLGPTFAANQIGALVAGAAIGLAGTLIAASLTSPPVADIQEESEARERDRRGTAGIGNNLLQQGTTPPRAIGTIRIAPPLLSEPIIDLDGDVEVAEVIMGLAGPHSLQDIRIGKIPISTMDEVQFETSEGTPGSVLPSLINRQAKNSNVSAKMSEHLTSPDDGVSLEDQGNPSVSLPDWHRLVGGTDPDEIWLDLTWPTGNFRTDGSTSPPTVALRVRIRKIGEEDWINLPELHHQSDRPSTFKRFIKIKFQEAPTLLPTPPTSDGFFYAHINTPAQSNEPAGVSWVADSHFDSNLENDEYLSANNFGSSDVRNIALYNNRVEVYMDPEDIGTYELEIKRSFWYGPGVFEESTYEVDEVVWDLFGYQLIESVAEVQRDQRNASTQIVINNVVSIWNEHPVQTEGLAIIALKVRDRQLDVLNVLASGYINVYDDYDDNWDTIGTSSNPAENLRYVLTGDLNAIPLPLALLNNDELLDWRDICISKNYQVNMEVRGKSVQQVSDTIASCGYAKVRRSEEWGIIIDRDRTEESPIQLFSPRNISDFSWTKGFNIRPDGFRISFRNIDKDYENDEIIILDPEEDSDGVRLESITYEGLVREDEVRLRALFDFLQSRLRSVFYSSKVDIEHIVCKRGDLIALQHDSLDDHAGFSRIKSIQFDDEDPNLIESITLDGSVFYDRFGFYRDGDNDFYKDGYNDFYKEPDLGVAIQCNDGTLLTKKVTGDLDDIFELTFDVPFEDADEKIFIGAHVTTGKFNSEYTRKLILDITYEDDKTANIVFVNEASELFDIGISLVEENGEEENGEEENGEENGNGNGNGEEETFFEGDNQTVGSLYEISQAMAGGDDDMSAPDNGGILTVNGESLGGYDYVIKDGNQTIIDEFNNNVWFTEIEDSRSAFVVVKGDLEINNGALFTPENRKLFTVVYVTGDLTINGKITMTARGSKHGPSNGNVANADIRIANGTFSGVENPQIPANGGLGAAGANLGGGGGTKAGEDGGDGSDGATGGGGSGSVIGSNSGSGDGSDGTSFGGGSASGGSQDSNGEDAEDNGGKGGDGGGVDCGGGSGNPGGDDGGWSGIGDPTEDGGDGTGGVLIVICEGTLKGNGSVEARGIVGGDGRFARGGSSGGGSVNVFYGVDESSVTVNANGGPSLDYVAKGGRGGHGTARKLEIPSL